MSLVYWVSSTGSSVCCVSVTAVELTLNPEQFSSLTHPSMIIPGSVLCPQVIGGPTNFIVIDIQTQQLLYSAKNLPCFPSRLRWTGSTSSERMTEPNGASPQDGPRERAGCRGVNLAGSMLQYEHREPWSFALHGSFLCATLHWSDVHIPATGQAIPQSKHHRSLNKREL